MRRLGPLDYRGPLPRARIGEDLSKRGSYKDARRLLMNVGQYYQPHWYARLTNHGKGRYTIDCALMDRRLYPYGEGKTCSLKEIYAYLDGLHYFLNADNPRPLGGLREAVAMLKELDKAEHNA